MRDKVRGDLPGWAAVVAAELEFRLLFRARLIADPRAAVEEAAGIRLPDDYRIHVHEESATDAHVVLPPNPKLSREQLDHLAGGLKKPPKWP